MVPFEEVLDVEKIHVQAPTEIIFLCGGPYSDISDPKPLSLRDAFLKVAEFPAIKGRDVVLAEDFTKLHVFSSHYSNFLQFETHLAQITELVLLFCESVGSFTELGAFAMIPDVAARMLVIIRDSNWISDSFIKLGPLAYLQEKYADSVCVIEDGVLGILPRRVDGLDLAKFKGELDSVLRVRLDVMKEPSTFDSHRPGHMIKLIVGYCQEYGALIFEEILFISKKFDHDLVDSEVRSYLLCAMSVGWLVEKRKGLRSFYAAPHDKPAITFVVKSPGIEKNRLRRKTIIREYWRENDEQRFRAIAEAVGGR